MTGKMRNLETNNYLPKRVLFALVGEKWFSKIKLFKHILDYKLGLPFELSPLYKYFLTSDSVALDIGANFGQNSCRLNKAIGKGNGHVYCFEPVNSNYRSLETLKKRLKLQNVTIVQKAVSNIPGNASIYIPMFDNGFVIATRSTLLNIEGIRHRTEPVMVTTIDEFVEGNGIAKVDFIKCDTEGNELNVLEGGRNTIMKFLPVLSFEMSHKNPGMKWLVDFGYKLFYFDKAIQKLRIINGYQSGNLIFVHQQRMNDLSNIIQR